MEYKLDILKEYISKQKIFSWQKGKMSLELVLSIYKVFMLFQKKKVFMYIHMFFFEEKNKTYVGENYQNYVKELGRVFGLASVSFNSSKSFHFLAFFHTSSSTQVTSVLAIYLDLAS